MAAVLGGALGAMGSLGYGQAADGGLLDQQLGDKPANNAAPADSAKPGTGNTVAPVAKPADAKPAGAAAGPENTIISPEAAKKVDDQELINQLTKPNADKPSPQQAAAQMKAMIERMGDSQHKLKDEKDPGEVTQETQRRIVMDLDTLIELAKQMQSSGSSSSSGQPQDGQQRQQSQNNGGQGGNFANTSERLPGGGAADAATGDMRNHDPASWGSLPPRDRDQVANGANEEYLPAYKQQIERYYQGLAEMAKPKNR
jgi:hypothetical protein